MKKIVFAILLTLGIIAGVVYFFFPSIVKPKSPADITSFEACAAAKGLVVDTKPRECHTKTGQVFVEVYNQSLLIDYIEVTAPKANQKVTSPFKIEGQAKGFWYYNDQLLVKLVDENEKIIVTKPIKALSSTKTDNFVPFVAAIDFLPPETTKGKLIIEKTNSTHRDVENGPLIIPVRFK